MNEKECISYINSNYMSIPILDTIISCLNKKRGFSYFWDWKKEYNTL